jgi:hypothetical protein
LKRISPGFDRFEAEDGAESDEAASRASDPKVGTGFGKNPMLIDLYSGFFDIFDAPFRIGRRKSTEGRGIRSASFSWHRRHGVAGSDLGDDTEPWQDRQRLSYAASSLASRQLLAVLHMASRLHPITKDETHVRHPSRRNRMGRS